MSILSNTLNSYKLFKHTFNPVLSLPKHILLTVKVFNNVLAIKLCLIVIFSFSFAVFLSFSPIVVSGQIKAITNSRTSFPQRLIRSVLRKRPSKTPTSPTNTNVLFVIPLSSSIYCPVLHHLHIETTSNCFLNHFLLLENKPNPLPSSVMHHVSVF